MAGVAPASEGHGRWTPHAIHRHRSTSTAASSRPNVSQELWNTDTHRRSWNTSSGGGAVAWGPRAAFAGEAVRRRAVSATGARTAGAIRPIRPKNALASMVPGSRIGRSARKYARSGPESSVLPQARRFPSENNKCLPRHSASTGGEERTLPEERAIARDAVADPDVSFRVLSDVARSLVSESDLTRLLESIADAVATLIPYDGLVLYQADLVLRELRPTFARHRRGDEFYRQPAIRFGEGLTGFGA